MGFLTPDPYGGIHHCTKPERPGTLGAGTRWQCDDCGAIYRVEMVWDRNIMSLEWVLKTPARPAAPERKCGRLVRRGVHRCVLALGHDGTCEAAQKSPAE